MTPTSLQVALREALQAGADPDRAKQQQAYMKSTMPYVGFTTPELRRLAKDLCKQQVCPDASTWQSCILKLWREAQVREERYAALEILGLKRYRQAWLGPEHMDMLRELVVTGAWWDYVDTIAINSVGYLLREYDAEIKPLIYHWAIDEHLWIRRTSILAQLKFKGATDTTLLEYAIEHSTDDPDFFARKAIGWALREYSKTKPEWVIDYIDRNRERLSPLSIREGLKVLTKQGLV